MTSLLVLVILVLVVIAIWQLNKIFNLTQLKGMENTQIANEKDNNVNGNLMFAFLAFIYIFTIYGFYKWGHLVLGAPASEHGVDVDRLMNITWAIIFTVQALTQALLHYYAFKYKGTKDSKATFFADSTKLEMIWTGIPVVVLTILVGYGLYAWNTIMYVAEEEDVLVVELYAKQFSWDARYAGDDNTLGKSNVRYIEGINTLGIDVSDPNAKDDKMVKELHLPKGKKVVFKIRSQDVLHSAYMPHFRAQMNCVPGMVTQFAFVPTFTTAEYRKKDVIVEKVKTINEIRVEKSKELVANGEEALDVYEFDYLLLCNKICGASHYNMQMKIVVDTPEDFAKWIAEQPTFGATMAAQNAEKNEVVEVVEKVALPVQDSTHVDSTKI